MKRIAKFVAVVASIAIFVMPAAAMPLRCMLMTQPGESSAPCHMMGISSSAAAEQVSAPVDHSCCQVSAAKTESTAVPQSPSGKGIVAPPTTNTFLSDLPVAPVLHELLGWTVPSPGGPPQAALCTFLI